MQLTIDPNPVLSGLFFRPLLFVAGIQLNPNKSAMGTDGRCRNLSPMVFNYFPTDRQAEAHPLRLCRYKSLENAAQLLRIDAGSAILHVDNDRAAIQNIRSYF